MILECGTFSFAVRKTPEPEDLRGIANAPGVKILAHLVPQVLLVEASQEAADKLRSDLKKWSISEEIIYSLPSARSGDPGPRKSELRRNNSYPKRKQQ